MSYSWITLIIVAVATILAWEFIYNFGKIKLKREDSFYYFYDLDVSTDNVSSFNNQLLTERNGEQIFSYGIQQIEPTEIVENYDVFTGIIRAIDGDAMISSSAENEVKGKDYTTRRVDGIIDAYPVYDFDKLVKDATEYLAKYLENDGSALEFSNLSRDKIEEEFLKKAKGDNRFRTDKEKAEGLEKEFSRIEELCGATKRLSLLLLHDKTLAEDEKIFYTYKKYTQAIKTLEEQDREYYEKLQETEETLRYGINLDKLTGGRHKTEDYFRLSNSASDSSKNVVLIGFNYYEKQPFFQFELITFVDYVVSAYGNFSFYA